MILDEGFSVVKVASYDCASYTLIRELIDSFSELIVSTGATLTMSLLAASILKIPQNLSPFALCYSISYIHGK